MSKDELKEVLAGKVLSTDKVERALYEAERDCVLSSYPFIKGWVYECVK